MKRFGNVCGSRRKLLLSAAGLLALALPVVFGVAHATQSRAQSQQLAGAQSAPAPARQYEYEVVSIKPTGPKPDTGSDGYSSNKFPDGLRITGATLRALVMFAYNPISPGGVGVGWRRDQILGAPSWAASDSFAIDAKMDASAMDALNKLDPDQQEVTRQQMLRTLLAEYFKLAIHTETRELPAYLLVVAKGGPKFREATPGEERRVGILPGGGGSRRITCQACSFELVLAALSAAAGRQVVNNTSLTGKYDFQLQWMPDNGSVAAASAMADSPWPPISKALEEQLGLRLEPGTGRVPVLLIDHVERPSGN
jgi:bla regulator protein blaR1